MAHGCQQEITVCGGLLCQLLGIRAFFFLLLLIHILNPVFVNSFYQPNLSVLQLFTSSIRRPTAITAELARLVFFFFLKNRAFLNDEDVHHTQRRLE